MNLRVLTTPALFAVAIGLAGASITSAQNVETGFLNRTVLLDATEYRYQVYVPRDFRRSTAWPVILALHGGGSYGNDGLRQTDGAFAGTIRQHVERFPAVVVFPQSHADGTPGWQGKGGEAALAALDKTIAEFNGDKSRVYLPAFPPPETEAGIWPITTLSGLRPSWWCAGSSQSFVAPPAVFCIHPLRRLPRRIRTRLWQR